MVLVYSQSCATARRCHPRKFPPPHKERLCCCAPLLPCLSGSALCLCGFARSGRSLHVAGATQRVAFLPAFFHTAERFQSSSVAWRAAILCFFMVNNIPLNSYITLCLSTLVLFKKLGCGTIYHLGPFFKHTVH